MIHSRPSRSSAKSPFFRFAFAAVGIAITTACAPGDRDATSDRDGASDREAVSAAAAPTAPLEQLERDFATCESIGLGTPAGMAIDTVATGLEAPWDLVFLPDGGILVTERPGRIRLIDSEGLRAEPWAELDVARVAEAGLLGIDFGPDYAETGHVYAMATFQDVPSGRVARIVSALARRVSRLANSEGESVWKNRVVRFTDEGNRGVDPTVVIDALPSGPLHAGGALRFGPDGSLYLGLGDGAEPPAAADPASLRGKILRFGMSGEAAAGNPRAGSPVFALGLRNPQAFDWDPIGGDFLAIDHGPTGLEREDFRRDQDELNRIIPGGDYGWPTVAGSWVGGGFETPLVEWTPAIAPAGMTFVNAPGSAWHGNVIVAGLRGQALRRVVLERAAADDGSAAGSMRALCEETLFQEDFGRLRGVRSGPNGALYFTTSNRDQRGAPREMDDLLLRIRPPAALP